ncbi:hypothetical protein C8R41DRAFT_924906 [Lentinula lateritia]|uniref:BRCT domain-containing protein n=1 Tax=Lentinula lateritia TaxID=40482 RepID=A0ABQ8V6G9_9AGAR|nr:hypothetical protein C8R41DRAFT_924906 [Lentinula lateritia]
MEDPSEIIELGPSENAVVVSGNKRSPSPTILDGQPRMKRPRVPPTICCHFEAVQAVQETSHDPKSDPPELKVLDECVLFVDVWMSHGESTSPIFIDIAESLGAKIMKRLGPGCTHIVYTLGRQSTVDKYFSAFKEEQRPKVVGAAWLKDCNTAALHLEEGPYLVDMEQYHTYHIGGVQRIRHRRRRTLKYHAKNVGGTGDELDISLDSPNARTRHERNPTSARIY